MNLEDKKPALTACIVTLMLAFWMFYIEDRSPVENLLTDQTNWVVQGQKYVDAKKSENFAPTDPVLALVDTTKPGWAQTLCNFESYTSQFGTVLGLCSTPYFHIERGIDPVLHDDIDVVHDESPFLVNGKPPDKWKEALQKSLILKRFAMHDGNYLMSVLFLPQIGS